MIPNVFYPAQRWTADNPDTQIDPCCMGSAVYGTDHCTCWQPVYSTGQADPIPVDRPELLLTQKRMCGDCAYRPGSPERTDEWTFDQLERIPHTGEPFWCHDGMRRPDSWQHPDGRTVPVDPADYHPLREGNFIYQADGSPALLCAGWMWRRVQAGSPAAPVFQQPMPGRPFAC